MPDEDNLEAQLVQLQERLSFLDDEVVHLTRTVAEQQRIIERLQAQIGLLSSRLSQLQEGAPEAPGHERPPHY